MPPIEQLGFLFEQKKIDFCLVIIQKVGATDEVFLVEHKQQKISMSSNGA